MATTFEPGVISQEPAVGYTPSSAVTAYTCVMQDDHPYMANVDIPANIRGSLIPRGGTYQVTTAQTATAPTAGKDVFWDPSGQLLSVDPSSDAAGSYRHYGRVSPGTPVVDNGNGSYSFEVEHDPNGEIITVSE